ncbi:MAG: class I SAM-dependent methyltransferase [Anaerolineae bacterium]|nr:class I SAM-dependent methyltransferase [Anaerolineae bacterium]
MSSYQHSAAIYDAIYSFKDYAREAQDVHTVIQRHCRVKTDDHLTLLDVACGSGHHLQHLQQHYAAQGLDLEPGLLDVARERCPNIIFVQGDMLDFDLGVQFDAITCLFSAIGYVKTLDRLRAAVANMARHLHPGGVLVIEPWFAPEDWQPNTPHANFIDEPARKIARLTTSELCGSEDDGWFSRNDMHYLIATTDGVEHFVERHELGLFTSEHYLAAFRAARLEVIYDPKGITGRGLYIGLQS